MDGISVYSEDTRTTLVPNEFIDYYMPRANGAFVKVYLYLLRCLTAPEAGFGIGAIADAIHEISANYDTYLQALEGFLDAHRVSDSIEKILQSCEESCK